MAKLFLSYSRVDKSATDHIVEKLSQNYGSDNIWYDQKAHGGAEWWSEILSQINECDIFIYIVTEDSLNSPYCQAEFLEAKRLKRYILPIIVRSVKHIPDDLQDHQIIDTPSLETSVTDLQKKVDDFQPGRSLKHKLATTTSITNTPDSKFTLTKSILVSFIYLVSIVAIEVIFRPLLGSIALESETLALIALTVEIILFLLLIRITLNSFLTVIRSITQLLQLTRRSEKSSIKKEDTQSE